MILPLSRRQLRHFILSLTTILCALAPLQVYADDQSDLHFIKYNAPFYDPNDTCDPGAVTASTTGGVAAAPGSDNEETIWNNLIANQFKPWMAAGIMGNMQSESGFDPFIIQGGGHSYDPAATSNGYGLVQWTPGSKLKPYIPGGIVSQDVHTAIAQEVSALHSQLTGVAPSSEKGAGNALFASTDVPSATVAFELQYERHAPPAQPARTTQAQAIMQLAKDKNWTQAAAPGALGTPVSSTTGGGCGATGVTNAALTGGCTNPVPDPAYTLSRTDDGVDYGATKSVPLLAICDMTILEAHADEGWGPGSSFIYARLNSGPFKDKCWYYAEHLDKASLPKAGTQIPAGQVVATFVPGGWNLEIGFAQAYSLAATRVGEGNYPSESGRAAAKFLRSLGARTQEDPDHDKRNSPAPNYGGASCPVQVNKV